MTVQFLPPRPDLIAGLRLRQADLIEVGLSNPNQDPQQVLHMSAAMSEEAAVAVDAEGEPLAVFGLAFDTGKPLAYPWMLSADSVAAHPVTTVRAALRVLDWWKRRSGSRLLCNYIHRDNAPARQFIERLGAVIVPTPHGVFDFFFFPNHV